LAKILRRARPPGGNGFQASFFFFEQTCFSLFTTGAVPIIDLRDTGFAFMRSRRIPVSVYTAHAIRTGNVYPSSAKLQLQLQPQP
jgi:hypothetical protein